MLLSRKGRRRSRAVAALAAFLTLASLVLAPTNPATATPPPPNPPDSQIQSAKAHKDALANRVGELSAQAATLQNQMQQLAAQQELAEQKFVFALSKMQQAKLAATQAQAGVRTAQVKVVSAQKEFRAYVQAAYMGGQVGGTTGALLTAGDPNVLLQQSALQNYQSSHQIGAIDNLQKATVGKSNADAAARAAVKARTEATQAAAQAKQQADAAVVAARAQSQQLQATIAANQTALDSARSELATLNGQRAVYLAYQAEQARIAAERARQAELARERAARLAAQQAARDAAAEQASRNSSHHGSSGSSGGGGGGGGYSDSGGSSGSSGSGGSSSGGGGGSSSGGGSGYVPAPSGGSWSAAKGRAAVQRAERYLGWMYAWAGGDASGPTYGVCAGGGAYNDCNVIGFDCSGLTIYAWAPYISFDHLASNQFGQAGSVHPDTGSLMPGDLVFWSSDGTVGGIHHVAMYIGGGNVIQAPQSGDVIKITPLGQVDYGYFGATRPMT